MSDEDNQVVETINPTDEQEIESTPVDTEEVIAQDEPAFTEHEFKMWKKRAKEAEAKVKEFKAQPSAQPTQQINNVPSHEDIEVTVLKAQGIDAQLLDEMKALAKVRGKSVLEMKNDPIIVAIREQREAQAKAEKAKLGASRGSGQNKPGKTITSTGLSPSEHKNLWREQNSK